MMPNRKTNEVKPDPKPVLRGVIGIVVPKKAPEASTPVYKYFKDNADYSENKFTSTEDTKSFRLQIEQHLNDIAQIDHKSNIKTDNPSISEIHHDDGFLKSLKNDENVDTCFNIIKNAVSQVEVVEKKSEIKEVRDVPKMPKTNLLVPLEMVKEKGGDFFKGTKHRKEKKIKEKKLPKLIRLDEIQEVNPGAVYQIDIQPKIINRWQEKQGSKLFENQPNPEEEEEKALLEIVMRESIKTAKMEKQRRVQEDLLYDDLNRDIERDKQKYRGSSLTTVLDDKCKEIVIDECTLAQVRSIQLPESDSAWDEELEEMKKAEDMINAKKEKKTSLNRKLKQLNHYGPNPVQELVPKRQREKKKLENKEPESAKLKAEENKENSDELVFVDPEEEEEEVKEKKKDNIMAVNESIKCNVFGDVPEDLIERNSISLNIINPEGAEEMNVIEKKPSPKTDIKNKYQPKQIYWNSAVDPVDKGTSVRNQYENNNGVKYDFDKPGRGSFFGDSDIKIDKPNPKTEPKINRWNLTAKADDKGFSSEYQIRRREAKNESPKKPPSKRIVEIFPDEDIPQFRSPQKKKDFEIFENIPDMEKKDSDDPFQDFEDDARKINNDLNGGKPDSSSTSSDVEISGEVVAKYLEKILFQKCMEKEFKKMTDQYSLNQNFQYSYLPNSNAVQNMFMNNSMNLPQTADQQQQLNNLLLSLNNRQSDMPQQQGMNLAQMTNQQQQLNGMFQQSNQGAGLSQMTNQQPAGLHQMMNQQLINNLLQQSNQQPTELSQMTDQRQVLNNMLQQQLPLPQTTDQQQLFNSYQQNNQQAPNQQQLLNFYQQNNQQTPNLPQTTDEQQLLNLYQQNNQQAPNLPQTTDHQQQLLNLLPQNNQQVPNLPQTTDHQQMLNLLQQSNQQVPILPQQQIGDFSNHQDLLQMNMQLLQIDPNSLPPDPQPDFHPETNYHNILSPIQEENSRTEPSEEEEEISTVETLKMKILKLEKEIAKQQQELEQRGSRSESSGSQESQPVEEVEENPPTENPPAENPPAENPPASPGFPNQFAPPFQPRYIHQPGMFPPNQMPVYYSYVPPWDPMAPMGAVPLVPPFPPSPYMGRMRLPVRAPFVPGPL